MINWLGQGILHCFDGHKGCFWLSREKEGNSQVQGDHQAEGYEDKGQEHRVLMQVFHGDGKNSRRSCEGVWAFVAAVRCDERRGNHSRL